jgi:D-glycero-D-manno-heptose 1,7-bisphosphate phosphatase
MKALFLDRDGILNEIVLRSDCIGSPRSLEELRIVPDAAYLIKVARQYHYLSIVITNQPDVARGKMDLSQLTKINNLLKSTLNFDDMVVSMSEDDSDYHRKPNPGMILDSIEKHSLNSSKSLLLGDSIRDIIAGRKSGIPTIFLQTWYNKSDHGCGDFNCNSLLEVVEIIRTQDDL